VEQSWCSRINAGTRRLSLNACTIADNRSCSHDPYGNDPSDAALRLAGCDALLSRCVVRNNSGPYHCLGAVAVGGGNAEIRNCIFTDNQGAGLFTEGRPQVRFSNCLWRNDYLSLDAKRDAPPTVAFNCILWDDFSDYAIHDPNALLKISYSIVRGGWPGEGNIDAMPWFADLVDMPYALVPGSPGIDAGDPTTYDGVCDLNPSWPEGFRDGPRADMGAYGGPDNWLLYTEDEIW
jgi:hypothetical protein